MRKNVVGKDILYTHYKNSAKRRNLEFSLTPEEFYILTSSICHYCGCAPYQKITNSVASEETKKHNMYIYNGIDRKDNKIGYILNNSLPCCGICNHMRKLLPIEDFIKQVEAIYKHYILGSS
jgi:hypothetical protein